MIYAAKIGLSAYSYVLFSTYSSQTPILVLLLFLAILCASCDLFMLGVFVVTTYKFSKIILIGNKNAIVKVFLGFVVLFIFVASTKKVWDHSYDLYGAIHSPKKSNSCTENPS